MVNKENNSFKCKFCDLKIETIKILKKHLRRKHNNLTEREKNNQIREFITLFPEEKKKIKHPIINKSKKNKKNVYFDKTESSIKPIYTPMGNKK